MKITQLQRKAHAPLIGSSHAMLPDHWQVLTPSRSQAPADARGDTRTFLRYKIGLCHSGLAVARTMRIYARHVHGLCSVWCTAVAMWTSLSYNVSSVRNAKCFSEPSSVLIRFCATISNMQVYEGLTVGLIGILRESEAGPRVRREHAAENSCRARSARLACYC